VETATSSFEILQLNLQNLLLRVPDLPFTSVLLSRQLINVGQALTVMFDRQLRNFALTEVELRVLATLLSQPNSSAHPSDLCVRTSQSPPSMTRLTNILVNRGFITRRRSTHDRRQVVLQITERGERIVCQLLPKLFQPLRGIFEDISEIQQRNLIAQLRRIAERLEATHRSELYKGL